MQGSQPGGARLLGGYLFYEMPHFRDYADRIEAMAGLISGDADTRDFILSILTASFSGSLHIDDKKNARNISRARTRLSFRAGPSFALAEVNMQAVARVLLLKTITNPEVYSVSSTGAIAKDSGGELAVYPAIPDLIFVNYGIEFEISNIILPNNHTARSILASCIIESVTTAIRCIDDIGAVGYTTALRLLKYRLEFPVNPSVPASTSPAAYRRESGLRGQFASPGAPIGIDKS